MVHVERPRGASRRAARHLARAERLIDSFSTDSGFEPYCLAAFSYARHGLRGGRAPDEVQRSFRFELDGCCSHLTLLAATDSPWRIQVVRGLRHAGYEPWLSDDDSVDVRRWLRGSHLRVRELAFLRELGDRAEVTRWPRRAATERPGAVQHGRWPREEWRRVLGELATAGIDWDDVAIGVSRGVDIATPAPIGRLRIFVGTLLFDGGRCFVFASAFPVPQARGRQEPLPPRLARRLRETLQARGFKPDRARSADGKVIRGRLAFEKPARGVGAVARECSATFDALAAGVLASNGTHVSPTPARKTRGRAP